MNKIIGVSVTRKEVEKLVGRKEFAKHYAAVPKGYHGEFLLLDNGAKVNVINAHNRSSMTLKGYGQQHPMRNPGYTVDLVEILERLGR